MRILNKHNTHTLTNPQFSLISIRKIENLLKILSFSLFNLTTQTRHPTHIFFIMCVNYDTFFTSSFSHSFSTAKWYVLKVNFFKLFSNMRANIFFFSFSCNLMAIIKVFYTFIPVQTERKMRKENLFYEYDHFCLIMDDFQIVTL